MNIVIAILVAVVVVAVTAVVAMAAYVRHLQNSHREELSSYNDYIKEQAEYLAEAYAEQDALRDTIADVESHYEDAYLECREAKQQLANSHRCLELLLDHPLDRSSTVHNVSVFNKSA